MWHYPQCHRNRESECHTLRAVWKHYYAADDYNRRDCERDLQTALYHAHGHEQPSRRIDDGEDQHRWRQQAKDRNCFAPIGAKCNNNYLRGKQSTDDRYRNRYCQHKRVALKEVSTQLFRLVLKARQNGNGYASDRSRNLVGRQSDQLICPAVNSDNLRPPKAPQQNFVKIVGEMYNQSVQGNDAAKTHHGTDADIQGGPARNPSRMKPQLQRRREWERNTPSNKRPVSEAPYCHDQAHNA